MSAFNGKLIGEETLSLLKTGYVVEYQRKFLFFKFKKRKRYFDEYKDASEYSWKLRHKTTDVIFCIKEGKFMLHWRQEG